MSVDSKTKSYWIQGGYLSLFIIFHLPFDLRPLLLEVWPLIFLSPIQYKLLLSLFDLIAFVIRSIFYFCSCSRWPLCTSGSRHNSIHSWITHHYPIIHQDPFAKLAGSSRVMSRPSTLAFATSWSWFWRSKSQTCRVRLLVLSLLTCGSSWFFLDRVWVHSSCSTTPSLESRWSASSFLS